MDKLEQLTLNTRLLSEFDYKQAKKYFNMLLAFDAIKYLIDIDIERVGHNLYYKLYFAETFIQYISKKEHGIIKRGLEK